MAVLLGRQSAGANTDFEPSASTIAWDFVAIASGTLATVFAQTQTANAGFSSARLGIYADDAANGRPGSKLADFAVDSLAAAQGTGVFQASGFSTSVTSGTKYWLALSGTGEQIDFKGDTSGNYRAETTAMPASFGVGSTSGTTNMIIWGEDAGVPLPIPDLYVLQSNLRGN